jgi:hypothetical protein
MPHAQHMQGQQALFDQQVCSNEGGGLWVVLVMTRWLVPFPFPTLRTAAVGSNVVAAVTARAPQVSMFPSVSAESGCLPVFVPMPVSM